MTLTFGTIFHQTECLGHLVSTVHISINLSKHISLIFGLTEMIIGLYSFLFFFQLDLHSKVPPKPLNSGAHGEGFRGLIFHALGMVFKLLSDFVVHFFCNETF